MIRYVAKSGETVVWDNAVSCAIYTSDLYILANQVRALLVLPILRQGKLAAILSLENNLS